MKMKRRGKYILYMASFICLLFCITGCGNRSAVAAVTGSENVVHEKIGPREKFLNLFGVELPESADFEEIDMDDTNKFHAKIVLDAQDFAQLKEALNRGILPGPAVREENYNIEYDTGKFIFSENNIKFCRIAEDWFDLTYEDVDLFYYWFTEGMPDKEGRRVKSVINNILIHENENETITLYVMIG